MFVKPLKSKIISWLFDKKNQKKQKRNIVLVYRGKIIVQLVVELTDDETTNKPATKISLRGLTEWKYFSVL